MVKAIQLKNHPFRFLLYLEWGLLAVAMVSMVNGLETAPGRGVREGLRSGGFRGGGGLREGLNEGIRQGLAQGGHGGAPPPMFGWEHGPLIALILLIIFGLMGLYLPMGKISKLGHVLGQVLLVLLASAAVFNSGRAFPAVYLVLVIRSCLMFGLVGRITMTGVVFILFLTGLRFRVRSFLGLGRRLPPPIRERLQELIMGFQLNFIVLFGLSLLLVVLLINALLTERQSQKRLQHANQALRQSTQEIEKLAMDQERNRIARDIHDTLGHSLTALNIQLESALKLLEKDPSKAQQFMGNAKRLGSQSLREVRQSVATLRQDPLAGQTLESAIAQLLQNVQNRPDQNEPDQTTQLTITQQIQLNRPLPSNLNVILYRIVQEGLTNIVKHAKASHVHLQLAASAKVATLTLEDNGIGFYTAQARTGFGLQSMRDRAEAIGGTFSVTSTPRPPQTPKHTTSNRNFSNSGTQIQISLPIPKALPQQL
ncbi:MAG: sensor histidine kinase [Cyanobacteria bacterium P01_F01_bin.53]